MLHNIPHTQIPHVEPFNMPCIQFNRLFRAKRLERCGINGPFWREVKVIDFSQKWSQVQIHNNQCKGWVHTDHFVPLTEANDSTIRCIDFTEYVHQEERRIPIFIGCKLPNYDGITYTLHYGDYQWNFSGQSIHAKDLGMERFKRLGQNI